MSLQSELNAALENVTDLQYNTRKAICKQCPALNAVGMCKDCLCIIVVKAKLKSQACPKGLWK